MRRYCDKVLSILPFEVDYFRDKQLDVEYVGNPSVAEVERKKANMMSRGEMNMRFGLDGNRPLLALIPGSRKGEIRGNLPFMVETALNFPQLQPVVAAAPSMPISFYRELQIPKLNHIPIIENATFELMAHSEVALVTSGTATLECALLETPQVVCYRSSGKKWFYNLMSHVLKCPHISLPNLIANGLRGERYANEVVPELLMHHCNTTEMTAHLGNLLPGKPGREQMLNGYRRMKSQLTASSAPARAAASILASLRQ
jgi:lipid-A-disaccharide synthase